MDNLAKEREIYLQEKKNTEEKKKYDAHDKFKAYMLNNLDKIVVGDLKDLLIEKGQVVIEVLADGCSYSYGTLIQEGFLLKKSCYIPNADDFIWVDGIQAQYGDLLITTESNRGRNIHLTIMSHRILRDANVFLKKKSKNSDDNYVFENSKLTLFVSKRASYLFGMCILSMIVTAIFLTVVLLNINKDVSKYSMYGAITTALISYIFYSMSTYDKELIPKFSNELINELNELDCSKGIEDWG